MRLPGGGGGGGGEGGGGGDSGPAAARDVPPLMVDDLRALVAFSEYRDALVRRLMGGRVRNPALLAAIMRQIVLALAAKRRLSIRDCHARCKEHGSLSTVAAHIELLRAAGCVLLEAGADRRSKAVVPTKKLVEFYKVALDDFMLEIENYCEIRLKRRVKGLEARIALEARDKND